MEERGGKLPPTTSRRYRALDALRSLALVSMVSSHVDKSFHSTIARVTHSVRWIDGAFVFVVVSGVVTGIVHRRLVERRGVRASVVKLLRRAGFLYLVEVGLMVAILFAYNVHPTRGFVDTPTWAEGGGVTPLLVRVGLLERSFEWEHVLVWYVLFLLWAAVAVGLLVRRRWWLIGLLSIGAYLVSQVRPDVPGAFYLAWQLLFTGGLLAGWTFERERLAVPLHVRRGVVVVAAIAAVGLFVAARLAAAGVIDDPGTSVGKWNGGWLAFMFTAAFMISGHAALVGLERTRIGAPVVRAAAVAGQRGLPGYVAMVLALVVLDLAPDLPHLDPTVIAVVAVCVAAEVLTVRYYARRRERAVALAPA